MKKAHQLFLFLSVVPLFVSIASAGATSSSPTQSELNAASQQGINWLYATHDYTGQRYVDLDQITPQNVSHLHKVGDFQTSEVSPSQTNPLVYDGVMYITTAHTVAALNAATGQRIWEYVWSPKGKEIFNSNRGVAIKGGLIVRGMPDGYLIAIDATAGTLRWKKQIATASKGEFLSAPPLIADDKIIIGPAGAEWAAKGWVGAFRLKDGAQLWKFNTVPDANESAAETWGKDKSVLEHGGGNVWTPMSYDSAKGLVYIAVGNPAPDFYDSIRPGNNLYTCSLIALDIKTGKLNWYFQAVPHDVHDWDITQASPLFTTTINGTKRDLIAVAGKDGLLRVLDRTSHKLLYSVPFTRREHTDVPLSTKKGIHVFPGILGGEEWSGPAYNRITDMLYVPSVEWGATYKRADHLDPPNEKELYMGGTFDMDSSAKARGSLTAFDAATGEVRWVYKSSAPMLAGVSTTAGGMIFTGSHDKNFIALEAKTGKVLYKFNLGAPIAGNVITYAVNGKQYVAVVSGFVSPFFKKLGGGPTKITIFALP